MQSRNLVRYFSLLAVLATAFANVAVAQAKTLRIFARGPRGANRIFEYRDNDVVDGSMFSGWGGGNWGGGGWNGGWNPPGWGIGRPPASPESWHPASHADRGPADIQR